MSKSKIYFGYNFFFLTFVCLDHYTRDPLCPLFCPSISPLPTIISYHHPHLLSLSLFYLLPFIPKYQQPPTPVQSYKIKISNRWRVRELKRKRLQHSSDMLLLQLKWLKSGWFLPFKLQPPGLAATMNFHSVRCKMATNSSPSLLIFSHQTISWKKNISKYQKSIIIINNYRTQLRLGLLSWSPSPSSLPQHQIIIDTIITLLSTPPHQNQVGELIRRKPKFNWIINGTPIILIAS